MASVCSFWPIFVMQQPKWQPFGEKDIAKIWLYILDMSFLCFQRDPTTIFLIAYWKLS
jgi:hypothetical protein